MKSQNIPKKKQEKTVTVLSDKKPKIKPPPKVPPGVTLRTIHFIEIGEMSPKNIQLMIQELNATYNPAEQGIHFVVPVRNGKIGTDIVFEAEFLSVVRETCEVARTGEIVLKGGAREVQVIRERF
jgi:hypothetical protein